MLNANGTCVSRIVKSRAGSSGSRRRQESLRGRRPASANGAVALCVRSSPHPGGDVLAVLERRVDRGPPGDHRGELLGALVADVLELRDADVLDTRDTGTRRGAGIVDRRGRDRVERGLGERGGGLLVLGYVVRRLARAGRNRGPSAGDPLARLLEV